MLISWHGEKIRRSEETCGSFYIERKYTQYLLKGSVAKLKLYAHLYKTIKANIVVTVKSFVIINYFRFSVLKSHAFLSSTSFSS
jgi:hypothetical protein